MGLDGVSERGRGPWPSIHVLIVSTKELYNLIQLKEGYVIIS